MDNFKKKVCVDVMHVCGQAQTQNFSLVGGGEERADPEAICNLFDFKKLCYKNYNTTVT